MTDKIKLYGPMRSCTNYTGKLMKDHCDVELEPTPWKHGLPEEDESVKGYIFCNKNPYALWESFKRGFEKGRVLCNHFKNHDSNWFTDDELLVKLQKATENKDADYLKNEDVLKTWIEKQNDLYEAYLKFYREHKDISGIVVHKDLISHSKHIVKMLGEELDLSQIKKSFEEVENEVTTEQQETGKKFDEIYYTHKKYLRNMENWERELITENIDWNLARQLEFEPNPVSKRVKMKDKINLVYYGDFGCHSGFGRVSDGILTNLPESWQIRALGINYAPGQKEENYGDNIEGFSLKYIDNNPYGPREVNSYLQQTDFDYDLVFTLQDPFVYDSPVGEGKKGPVKFLEQISKVTHKQDSRLVSYFPIDTFMPNPKWFETILPSCDRTVAYLDWAKDKIVDAVDGDKYDLSKLDVIKHGCDNEKFYPLPDKVRKQGRKILDVKDNEFLFFWLSANQRRKNIPRDVMGAFAKFYDEYEWTDKRPRLIMKTSEDKSDREGWDLNVIREQLHEMYDIDPDTIGFLDRHYSHEELNLLYNCADCVYLPSMEGHGLSVTEAYSAKRPVITANHAALKEVGNNKSLQIDVPDKLSNYIWFTKDNNVPRSVIDVEDATKKFAKIMEMSDNDREELAQKGYDWAQAHSWETQAKKWQSLFEEVLNE